MDLLESFASTLVQKLTEHGLFQRLDIQLSGNAAADLETITSDLISALSVLDEDHSVLQAQAAKNDEALVKQLDELSNLRKNLEELHIALGQWGAPSKVSRQLWTTVQFYNGIVASLEEFSPVNEEVATRLANDLVEQIVPLELKISTETNDQSTMDQANAILKNEYMALEDLMRKNDEEYAAQIQRYNILVQDMKTNITRLEAELYRSRHSDAVIQDLELQLARLREERYRDGIVIQNMARKIRNYEREKGSHVFVSPPSHMPPPRMFQSPNASRTYANQSYDRINRYAVSPQQGRA